MKRLMLATMIVMAGCAGPADPRASRLAAGDRAILTTSFSGSIIVGTDGPRGRLGLNYEAVPAGSEAFVDADAANADVVPETDGTAGAKPEPGAPLVDRRMVRITVADGPSKGLSSIVNRFHLRPIPR